MTDRALRAGFWSVLLRSSMRFIAFIRNVVLARLLAPADFGLFGIALVMLSIVERFSSTGLRGAIIQKKADIGDYLDTAFTIQAFRGACLAAMLWLSAPYAAQFFGEPRATPFIQLLGITVFLRGVRNIGLVYYTRELEVQRQNVHTVVSDIVELLVSIVAAILLRNAWALMIGVLAGNVTSMVVSYVMHPYRPRLSLNLDKARELSRYGRWIFLSHILSFLAYRGDNFIIGKLLGAPALGIYLLAFSISEAATVGISQMMTSVAFPAYSRIQGEQARVQRAFSLAVDLVASLTMPAAVVLWLLAEPITLVVLGDRWLQVAFVLPPLAFAGVIRTLVANGTTVYKAVGRPDRAFLVSLATVIATYAAIFPLIQLYGLVGVGMAVLFGQLATIPVFLAQMWKILGVDWRSFVRMLMPAAVLSLAVALPVVMMDTFVEHFAIIELGLTLLLVSLSYLAAAVGLWQIKGKGPLQLLQLIARKRPSRKATASALSGSAP
ncbi:lipopolysaccharide biosynthesis protein [soil metagenome]